MKEFIEKLNARPEEESYTIYLDGYIASTEKKVVEFTDVQKIVNQLAEEYNKKYEPAIDLVEYGVDGYNLHLKEQYKKGYEDAKSESGWIPCSERLPEVSGEYYTYVYYDGHYMYSIDEIDCDGMIKKWNCASDYQILAWKPIAPYQPKGE